ncbi:hypothetical protein [Thermohalobacter berrensis]|uniref:DUF4367 domain-containing protein n=1 Tax=Thermohalobacter berrensis TaxID=99594 RepID=A0A419T9Q1_9FIRM|nr:hypothetical protein [Thermohalobacter berrensis]RKD34199.1 hypothetical protein BET03_07875 [Thermohalobacter berrensis]
MPRIISFILILIILTISVFGCTINKSKEIKGEFKSNNHLIDNLLKKEKINEEVKKLILNNNKYVNEMRYSYEKLNKLLSVAVKGGISNPYVPTVGVGTDYLMEVREGKDSIYLIFPHFTVEQSLTNLILEDNIKEKQIVKLDIGEGFWIKQKNNPPTLYIKLNDIYISIHSAKYFNKEKFEEIAKSLIPLLK